MSVAVVRWLDEKNCGREHELLDPALVDQAVGTITGTPELLWSRLTLKTIFECEDPDSDEHFFWGSTSQATLDTASDEHQHWSGR